MCCVHSYQQRISGEAEVRGEGLEGGDGPQGPQAAGQEAGQEAGCLGARSWLWLPPLDPRL